jgi:hypothetical protein
VSETRLAGAAIDMLYKCLHEWAVSTQCDQGSPADSDDAHRRRPSLPCGLLTRFIRRNQQAANRCPSFTPIWPGISELLRCQTPECSSGLSRRRNDECAICAIIRGRFPWELQSSATAPPSAHACVGVCICRHDDSSCRRMIRWERLASANNDTRRSRACSPKRK